MTWNLRGPSDARQPDADAVRAAKPSDALRSATPRCPVCADTRVITTSRPGATSPRPCPACDPTGERLTDTEPKR